MKNSTRRRKYWLTSQPGKFWNFREFLKNIGILKDIKKIYVKYGKRKIG